MAELVVLKYKVPKLNFDQPASQPITYKVEVKKSTDANFTLVSSNYIADENGNNINNISFIAEDNLDYDIKFTNLFDSSKVFQLTFHTNAALEIGENPYVNVQLLAGQNRDLYINGLFATSLPDLDNGGILFTFDENYREAAGNISNMVPGNGTAFKSAIDSTDSDRALKGMYFNGTNSVKFNDVANDPAMQLRDTYLFGNSLISYTIGFFVLFENLTDKTILATGNATDYFKVRLESNKIKIAVSKSGTLKTALSNYDVEADKLYFLRISVNPQNPASNNIVLLHPTGNNNIPATNIDISPIVSNSQVWIGQDLPSDTVPNQKFGNFIFSYFYYFPNNTLASSDENKVIDPWGYKPKIRFQETSVTIPNPNPIIDIPNQWWLKFDDSKLAFVVPPDFEPGIYNHWIEQYNGNHLYEIEIEVKEAQKDEVGFDIDLSTGDFDTKMTELKSKFCAFHGQWGGANGGVNSHLVYVNKQDKTLILEQHGDNYQGDLQGVGKIAKNASWNGYGVPKYHDIPADPKYGQEWTTRVGSCIVSEGYLGYGEYNVWMKVPIGSYGYAPAIWLFHYQEFYTADPRWDYWIGRGAKPYGGNDPYMVINHEIDMELPSHITQGVFATWAELGLAYFDPLVIDDQIHVAVEEDLNASNIGLFRLNNPLQPNLRASWVKVSDTWDVTNMPTMAACKFNNWVGEKASGSGWAYDQASYEDAEEYAAKLTQLEQNYADGQFHKWTIKWYADRTELWIDDVFIRDNKAFVPSIAGRLTIGGWFPSAVKDNDPTYWDYSPERAWAGFPADFDVLHLELKRVQFIPYSALEAGGSNDEFAESFPETNLRVIV